MATHGKDGRLWVSQALAARVTVGEAPASLIWAVVASVIGPSNCPEEAEWTRPPEQSQSRPTQSPP